MIKSYQVPTEASEADPSKRLTPEQLDALDKLLEAFHTVSDGTEKQQDEYLTALGGLA